MRLRPNKPRKSLTISNTLGPQTVLSLSLQSLSSSGVYFQQVSKLAFKNLKLCTPQDSVGYLVQQPAEPFPKFLTRVTNVIEKHIQFAPTEDILIKQLALEGLITIICYFISPVRNENIHKGRGS